MGAERIEGAGERGRTGSVAREPTRAEVIAVAGVLILSCVIAAHAAGGYWKLVAGHRDNPDYARIALAIRTGQIREAGDIQWFWGVSYAAAAVAGAIGISEIAALVVVAMTSSLAAVLLAYELWGGWVALFFLGADWTWLECSSYEVGSQPLFVALVFGSLLAVRRERWVLAGGLAALATTVRPLGVFVLAPIVAAAYWKRGKQAAAWAAAVAAVILILYCVPLAVVFHDPLANYHGYQRHDWAGGLPVTFPFKAIVENFRSRANLANTFIFTRYLKLAYVLAQLTALGLLGFCQAVRRRALERPVEIAFVVLYSAFIFTYNAPRWALAIHAYLLLPLIPFFLWAFEDWLPKRRLGAYGLGLVSMVLAWIGGMGGQTSHRLLLQILGLG